MLVIDGRNMKKSYQPVEVGGLSQYLHCLFDIPGGCFGFLPSTVITNAIISETCGFFSSTKRIEIESYTTMRRASGRTQRHLPLLLQVVFPREEEHPIHEQEPPVSSHKWNQACLEDVPPTSKGKWRLIGIHIHYTYKGKSRLIGIHIHYTYHRNPTIWKSSTTERCSLSSIPMSGQKSSTPQSVYLSG